MGKNQIRLSPSKTGLRSRSPSKTRQVEELKQPIITRPLNNVTVFEGEFCLLELCNTEHSVFRFSSFVFIAVFFCFLEADQLVAEKLIKTAFAGNRELLEVEVSAIPKPLVEWYLEGKLIAESRTLRTYFDGRVAFLKIYEAHEEHQGNYLCRISNKLGTAETRCRLIVSRKCRDFLT